MMKKFMKAVEDKEQGFTLIELLVVIIIIGLLAAIAIPVFLNQRKAAVDKQLESDARNVATEVETKFTTAYAYPNAASVSATSVDGNPVNLTDGNQLGTYISDGQNFCLTISRASGVQQGNITRVTVANTSGGVVTGAGCTSASAWS